MKAAETFELHITNNSNSFEFNRIADYIIKTLQGKLIRQIEGLDQIYWDFEINETIITLHSEHYLGISVYGKKSTDTQSIIEQIKSEFNLS